MKSKNVTPEQILTVFVLSFVCTLIGYSLYSFTRTKIAQNTETTEKPLVPIVANTAIAAVPLLSEIKNDTPIISTGEEDPALEPVVKTTEADKKLFTYIEVSNSCNAYFGGACVRVRSGPGTQYSEVTKLRTGTVLRTSDLIETEQGSWYKVVFNEWIRYPDRMQTENWYISSNFVTPVQAPGVEELDKNTPATNKHIVVSRKEQKLYAYDDDQLFMEVSVSTGLPDMPTPRGKFQIFKKVPSRYMQGPLPGISDQEYDLPGVPWTMYFTAEGAALHGAYWHNNFGQQWSHGCVNLPEKKAKELYEWADLGTEVLVRD